MISREAALLNGAKKAALIEGLHGGKEVWRLKEKTNVEFEPGLEKDTIDDTVANIVVGNKSQPLVGGPQHSPASDHVTA